MEGPSPEVLPQLLNIQQVAAYLGIGVSTIYEYIRQGRIPARKIGRRWLFLQEEVRAFLDEGSR